MMLKKGFIGTVVACALLFSTFPLGAAASSTEDTKRNVVKNTSLYSDDYLIKQAINGNELSVPKTDINVFKNEQVSIVELNKTLSETYEDGESIHKDGMLVLDISLDASNLSTQGELDEAIQEAFSNEGTLTSRYIEQIPSTFENKSVSPLSLESGNVASQKNDGSYTVHFRYNAYYDVYNKDGIAYFKIKYVNYVATLLDSAFSLTEINSIMGYFGPGYRESSGTFTASVYAQDDVSFKQTNPVSGRTYRKDTGFNYYVHNPDLTGGHSMMSAQATLKYKRNATGTVYSLEMPTLIARN